MFMVPEETANKGHPKSAEGRSNVRSGLDP